MVMIAETNYYANKIYWVVVVNYEYLFLPISIQSIMFCLH